MIIHIKHFKYKLLGLLLLLCSISLYVFFPRPETSFVMGGSLRIPDIQNEDVVAAFYSQQAHVMSDRFQRPSSLPALPLKYQFQLPENWEQDRPPYLLPGYPENYTTPEDVIHAYFSILQQAASPVGNYGGCGTVKWQSIPYPYGYELLSKATKQEMSLEDFKASFAGIGHITLLKLLPTFAPPDIPATTKHFMVEVEAITGPADSNTVSKKLSGSYFAYYYGMITTVYEEDTGWKIQSIDYIPEDFLCAPFHHWDWDSRFLVKIVYGDWYHLIHTIDRVEVHEYKVSVYARGDSGQYRFDFIRLSNGVDLLLQEWKDENGVWKEVNLLKPEHQTLKFSALNPVLEKNIME